MKSTGVVRPIDRMGRVVIPKEIRALLNLKDNVDSVEIFMDGDRVIIKKYQPTCVFCNEISSGVKYSGYNVCKDCIDKLKNISEGLIQPIED